MKRALEQIRKHWLENLITFLISILVGVTIFLIYFFLRNRTFLSAVDGMTIGGLFVLLSGLLAWMAHLGMFDMFSFGFIQLGHVLFSKNPRKGGDFVDYKANKCEKRNNSGYNFVAIIVAGLALCIAFIILRVIYNFQ